MKYFWADPHFNHPECIKHCNRPFGSIKEMEETLIDNWNRRVTKRDQGWIIGDLGFLTYNRAAKILSKLNGDLIFVEGNHDITNFKTQRRIREMGFRDVYQFKKLRLRKDLKVMVSHYPYFLNSDEPYAEYRIHDCGLWLLHGHIHNAWKVRVDLDHAGGEIRKMINVGVDVWDFKPVSERQICDIILG